MSLPKEINRLLPHWAAEGEGIHGKVGEEHSKRSWIQHSARKGVLTQPGSFLEDADFNFTQTATGFFIFLNEARQFDSSGQTSGPSPHEKHVHGDGFGIGDCIVKDGVSGDGWLEIQWPNLRARRNGRLRRLIRGSIHGTSVLEIVL
jgi:hypothetical protein